RGEPAADQEPDHQHDAVAGYLERAEMDDERVDGHGVSESARMSPGKGRSSRGSRSSPLRSPRSSRHPPAAPIIAALSVFSRGEATYTSARSASRVRSRSTSGRLQATPPPIIACG